MDFSLGERAEAVRQEVRDFLSTQPLDEVIERAWSSGTLHDWDLHRAMAERGLIAPAWPEELGGRGFDAIEQFAMLEELTKAHAPIDGLRTSMLVPETLRHVGTEEQRRAVIPPFLRGEILICLGYSEPESGSDVAAAATRAVRDGDEWVINGQKVFTSIAHQAAYIFLLTRTNTEVPKHKGLTLFLVPMDAPGIEVTPVQTMGGQLVNVTFLTDVRVPDSARVGDVDDGWRVMTVGLAAERVIVNSPGPMLARAVRAMEDFTRPDGTRVLDDPFVRQDLARAAIEAEVSRLLDYRSAWVATTGEMPGVEGSMAKAFGTASENRLVTMLLNVLGPEAMLKAGQPGALADGELEHAFRYAPFKEIAGGTTEIQLDIIAHRGLGLPR